METGANANTWGNNTNTNLETLDAFTAGYLSKSVAGSANVTLTTANADPTAESSNKVIEFTGALTGDITVFVPAVENNYIFFNNTSGAQTLTVAPTGHGANGVAITQGAHTIMYCTGNTMVDLFANSLGQLSVKSNLVVTGNTNVSGTVNVTGTTAFQDNVTVASGKSIDVNSAITLNANGLVSATSYSGNGAGLTGVDPFEANTSMVFNQASAPTGWTKQTGTALANTAMSIVTGTGGGTGGGDSFYSTFGTGRNTDTSGATVSVSGTVGGHTLSTPELASHSHPFTVTNQHPNSSPRQTARGSGNAPSTIGPSTGGGGSHSHPFSVSSSSLGGTISMPSMNVKYANVIIANKD
jgi:hypothetical protein